MLLGAEANAAEALEQQMLSRLDEQTLVGGESALVVSTHGGVEQAP
jgi:hypothetical protein